MYSNGNSFGTSAQSVATGDPASWPVPPWKFGAGPDTAIAGALQR